EGPGLRTTLGGRRKNVVDSEVAVRRGGYAGRIGVALDERRRRFADQRREDAGVRVAADAVAARQEEATPVDLDTAVRLHVRFQISDDPDLAGGGHAAHDVPGDIRKRSVGVRGSRDVRHRMDADPAREFHEGVVGRYRERTGYRQS